MAMAMLIGFMFFICAFVLFQGAGISSAESLADDIFTENGEVDVLETGENDKDMPGVEMAGDAAMSDDEPEEKFPAMAGNYAWQSLNNESLASFGNKSWYSGYEFVPEKDVAVSELCGYFDDSERQVGLYDESFSLLSEATVASDNGWSCVSISPVSVEKGKTYYVAAREENESVYYNYQCCEEPLLPVSAADIAIKAGVRQDASQNFGFGLKRYANLVLGLVDVKISNRNVQPSLPSGSRPLITDPQPTGTISNSKPLLSVRTNRNTTCKYDKTKKNYADMKYTFSKTGGKTHTKRIGELEDGDYTRFVRCKDSNGYKSYATKISFTVQNGSISNIKKPIMSDPKPTGTISDNTPVISIKTDEDANCRYCTKNLSYNDTTVCKDFGTTGGLSHSQTLNKLSDGDYAYYARCKDKAGNVNISSLKIAFTVDAGGDNDTTPPSISNVSVSPASEKIGASFKITAKVTDNNGIKSVKAKIQQPDGKTVASLTLYDDGAHSDGSAGDDVYGRKWLSTSRPAGKYYIDILAVDEYGNSKTKDNGAALTLTEDGGADDDSDDDANESCVSLLKNGPSSDKIDIVFLASNYGTDMVAFESDAKAHMKAIFAESPLNGYKSYFNVWIIKKTNLTSDSNLCTALNNVTEFKTLSAKCNADETAILSKSSGGSFGGCADPDNAVAFMLNTYTVAMPHELGHAIFKLWDEYVYSEAYSSGEFDDSYWCGSNPQVSFSDAPNCDTSSTCSKWSGVSGASCAKGCTCPDKYRPVENCMMRYYGSFCSVCSAQIKKIINNYK
jgi:hypothetical protein